MLGPKNINIIVQIYIILHYVILNLIEQKYEYNFNNVHLIEIFNKIYIIFYIEPYCKVLTNPFLFKTYTQNIHDW